MSEIMFRIQNESTTETVETAEGKAIRQVMSGINEHCGDDSESPYVVESITVKRSSDGGWLGIVKVLEVDVAEFDLTAKTGVLSALIGFVSESTPWETLAKIEREFDNGTLTLGIDKWSDWNKKGKKKSFRKRS